MFQRNDVLRRLANPGAGIDILTGFRCVGRRETGEEYLYDVGKAIETHGNRQRGDHRGDRRGDADRADDFTYTRAETDDREERSRRRYEETVQSKRGRLLPNRLYLLHATVLRVHDTLRWSGISI